MHLTHSPDSRTRWRPTSSVVLLYLWMGLLIGANAVLADPLVEERFIPLKDDDELTVQLHRPAQPNGWRILWLTPQYGAQEGHREIVIPGLVTAGAEVWEVDLLESLFLRRSSSSVRSRDGRAILALIQEAARAEPSVNGTEPRLLLVAAERLALPTLRALRLWQSAALADQQERLAGAVLLYPNLFTGTPVAGEQPELAPIVAATRLPVMIVQPQRGTHRWRLADLLSAMGQAPVFAWWIPGRADWYDAFLDEPSEADRVAARRLPQLLLQSGALLASQRAGAIPAAEPLAPMAAPTRHAGLVERPLQSAPTLVLPEATGQRVDLADYRGRVVLVSFWATWCPPCVEEIPSMNRLQAQFHPDDFAIVSVNFKESAKTILDFKIPIEFPVLLDADGRLSQRWQVFAFPSSFLLDRQGRIRYSANKAIVWDTAEVIDTIRTVADEERHELAETRR